LIDANLFGKINYKNRIRIILKTKDSIANSLVACTSHQYRNFRMNLDSGSWGISCLIQNRYMHPYRSSHICIHICNLFSSI